MSNSNNLYETQFGDIVKNKQTYAYDEYKKNLLSNIPAADLMNLYQDIAEADYGPLQDWQIVSPISEYNQEIFSKMSSLDYIDELVNKNKIVLYGADEIRYKQQYSAGMAAKFRPDLNPNLSEGPDTLFIQTGDDAMFELDTILHELGHLHSIKDTETAGSKKIKGGDEGAMTHNYDIDYYLSNPNKENSHKIWEKKMEEFILKYID